MLLNYISKHAHSHNDSQVTTSILHNNLFHVRVCVYSSDDGSGHSVPSGCHGGKQESALCGKNCHSEQWMNKCFVIRIGSMDKSTNGTLVM